MAAGAVKLFVSSDASSVGGWVVAPGIGARLRHRSAKRGSADGDLPATMSRTGRRPAPSSSSPVRSVDQGKPWRSSGSSLVARLVRFPRGAGVPGFLSPNPDDYHTRLAPRRLRRGPERGNRHQGILKRKSDDVRGGGPGDRFPRRCQSCLIVWTSPLPMTPTGPLSLCRGRAYVRSAIVKCLSCAFLHAGRCCAGLASSKVAQRPPPVRLDNFTPWRHSIATENISNAIAATMARGAQVCPQVGRSPARIAASPRLLARPRSIIASSPEPDARCDDRPRLASSPWRRGYEGTRDAAVSASDGKLAARLGCPHHR